METLLLIGRWNAVTKDLEGVIKKSIQDYAPARTLFVVTGADQPQTKRYPLSVDERAQLVKTLATRYCRHHEIYKVPDIADTSKWVAHLENFIATQSQGRQRIDPGSTIVVSGNREVLQLFEDTGYTAVFQDFVGQTPQDLIGAMVSLRSWRVMANDDTAKLYDAKGIEDRIRKIYADIQLTDDGELSTGREFGPYVRGMNASMDQKFADILPHVKPGRIVDKGCGTGRMLLELSARYPTSQIIGLELSREFLRLADGQHYPNQNVTVVKGNIIQPHFTPGSVDTAIFSSVIHEIYSYSRYDRDVVRLALGNTRGELKRGGRLIIRDGVRPPARRVWMRCDGTTESQFRRFAKQFKDTGFKFEEREYLKRTYFLLDMHEVNEFLTKKDYTENWTAEVREEFGVWTLPDWKRELEDMGYTIVEARSYLHPWMEKTRYENKVWLNSDGISVPGDPIPYPDTHMVIAAEA